jgi:small-conductance mechanosensitive channel
MQAAVEALQAYVGFGDVSFWRGVIETFALLVALLLVRVGVVRAILRWDKLPIENRRRWVVNTRNVAFIVFGFGVIIIWAEEMRTLALSMVAVAAALVLAFKEIISCVSGSMLRAVSRPFSVGDRIEVGGFRGDVIDQTILTTTLLEIGPGANHHQRTGRSITLPNSLFLNASIVNESYLDDFVLHLFAVPLKADDDWEQAEAALLEAARAECASFLEDARHQNREIEEKQGVDTPSMEPRVVVQLAALGQVNLVVRVPCPNREKGALEQAVVRHFLRSMRAARRAPPKEPPGPTTASHEAPEAAHPAP